MIIFFYGKDTYRSRQKLNGIVEHFKKIRKSGLNLKYFDVKTLDYQDLQDEIQQASIFNGKKLVVLVNTFSNLKFKKDFLANLESFVKSENIILIYENSTPLAGDSLFKFLKKESQFQQFEPLDAQDLRKWLMGESKNYKLQFEPMARQKLITFIGNDLWRFSNEIKKLASFKKNRKITVKDVETLVSSNIDVDIFKTIDAIASGDKKTALIFLHKHLEKGGDPKRLFHMINFQFRNLLILKSYQSEQPLYMNDIKRINQRLGLHPYVIKKGLVLSKKFSLDELKKIYRKIFQIDLKIKTGRLALKTALDLLIAEIS